MKKIFFISILIVEVFAYEGVVKKDSVTLKINGVGIDYKVGKKFSLKGGDEICFKRGKGRVVIKGKNYKKQLSSHTKRCITLPSSKEIVNNDSILDSVENPFEKSKEDEVFGVSKTSYEEQNLSEKDIIDLE